MGVVKVCPLGDGFTVGYLGHTGFHFALVFPFHPFDVNFEMKLAHTFNNGLVRFGINKGLEGWVLFGKAVECLGHLIRRFFILGCNGQGDNRLWYIHTGHGIINRRGTEGVSGGTINTEEGNNISWIAFVDIFHAVCVHANQAANLELLAGPGVIQFITLLNRTLINTDIGQLTILAILQLKAKGHCGEVFFCFKHDRGFVVIQIEGDIFYFVGVRQIPHNTIEQELDTLVFVGRSHHNRYKLFGNGSLPDGSIDEVFGYIFTCEIEFCKLIGEHGKTIQKFFPIFCRIGLEMGRNFGIPDLGPLVPIKIDRLLGNEIYKSFQFIFESDWNLDHIRVKAKFFPELHPYFKGIGTGPVTFVNKGDPGNMIPFQLPVYGNRLGLHTRNCTEDQNCTVENPQGSFNFDGKIHVSGGVDQVDDMVLPLNLGSGGLDGNTPFPFQFHVVHGGPYTVFTAYFMNGMYFVTIEQNTL
jgi:hypothetical protein